ncbi:MAG: cation-translocating P-type ATPase [Candidatus Gallimonas sp.]
MEQYELSKSQLFEKFSARAEGLTSEEAARRLLRYGANRIREQKKKSLAALFFSQFRDLMTIILICAAFLSAVLAFCTGDKSQLADTAILLFVIFLNAVVGFLQQYRADAAIEKLRSLSVCRAKVVRDGRVTEIDAEELVPGDVVEIDEGDMIPADCRILTADHFRADESALTGESHPVSKSDCAVRVSALAERKNTAHFSTFCVAGRARGMVVATGMETEMGKIAGLLEHSERVPSTLDRTVARLGKLISVVVLTVAAVLFLGGLLSRRSTFLQNLMSAVAVAVAAIPEGMGAVVTIILAMGVQRMSASRAVIRKLSAVETLGNCTCICSDKTGTLTQNRMTVEEIATDFSAAEERYEETATQREMLTCFRACNTVKGVPNAYLGDPTEIALVEYADRARFSVDPTPVDGIAFSSERKMMSVAAKTDGTTKLYVKGGLEVVLKRCTKISSPTGVRTMTKADEEAIRKRTGEYASRAMRVLAFAVGEYAGGVKEEELTFLGVAAMSDPPKEGAREAVEAFRRAGIRTVMITGDSAETAYAVARRLGVAERREQVITGEELDRMGEERYARRALDYTVYARVSPKHKSEIVRALQARGEVVAMTGDGVNDAPSVRAANIGVAMGSGTDVTKNAADMVIADDDFSTMVRAVEEGRNVFYNVKKTISFFLSTNLAEVLSVLFVTLFLWKYDFLTSTQLLWINLITDSLPVLALGVERTENVMNRPPVSANEIFCKQSLLRMAFFGLVQTAIVVGVFLTALRCWGNAAASTIAFFVLSFLELFHAFNVRTETRPLGLRGLVSNRTLLITVVAGVAVNVLLAVVPALREAFSLVPLGGAQWTTVFLSSLAVVPIGELYKAVCRMRRGVRTRGKRIPARGNTR